MIAIKALKHQSFVRLWIGQVISRLGDNVYRIALAWWVLQKTGSAGIMATVLIFSTVPMLLFLLLGGALVDRLPRVGIMLVCDAGRGIIITLVALLAFANHLEVWYLYIASMLTGIFDAFFQPAYVATVPDVTPKEVLPSANAITRISKDVAKVVGPALGAILVALGSTSMVFLINGLSFFISAIFLIQIQKLPEAVQVRSQQAAPLTEIRAGIAQVMKSAWLWISIAIAALSNVTVFSPFFVAMPFLVKDSLHADVDKLGLVYSMFAIGSVAGGIIISQAHILHRRGVIAYSIWCVSGLMTFAFGLSISVVFVSVASLIAGASIAAFDLIWTHTLQTLVPRNMLGRVSSIDALGSLVLLPIGYSIVGWITDQIGASLVFIMGGAITTGLIVLGLSIPAIRHLD
jgi:DHA3 family tetracycline resistance protein-like MFS transporter